MFQKKWILPWNFSQPKNGLRAQLQILQLANVFENWQLMDFVHGLRPKRLFVHEVHYAPTLMIITITKKIPKMNLVQSFLHVRSPFSQSERVYFFSASDLIKILNYYYR